MTEGQYQALQDEIAQGLTEKYASASYMRREVSETVMPIVERELSARDAVIAEIRALAKRWAAWAPDGTAPHPMYGAGQSATASGCAEELVAALSALPSTEDTQ